MNVALPTGSGALGTPAQAADDAVVGALLRAHYGLDGTLSRISGERDTNFRLDSNKATYLVKVTHPAEDPAAVAAQVAVLEHLHRTDPTLPIQRLHHTLQAETSVIYTGDPRRTLRVMQFLPGTLRRDAGYQAGFAASIGALAARLDQALRGFQHVGTAQSLLWDVRRAQDLRPLLPLLANDPAQETVRQALDRHADGLAALDSLPVQALHNDLNPTNLLVDIDTASVCGIIDFGDMIAAPAVVELAVAAAYLTDAPDPLAAIEHCAQAYCAREALDAVARSLLADLIATRWAMTVLITEWRARLQPDNAAYILRNNAGARRGLALLDRAAHARLTASLEEPAR